MASGSGWNLWVCLPGVKRYIQYIDFLILIILLFVHFFNVFRSYSLESEVKLDSFF